MIALAGRSVAISLVMESYTERSAMLEQTHAGLVKDLGGPVAVAAFINRRFNKTLTSQAISNMTARGCVAHRYRAALKAEAEARGVAVPPNFLEGCA